MAEGPASIHPRVWGKEYPEDAVPAELADKDAVGPAFVSYVTSRTTMPNGMRRS